MKPPIRQSRRARLSDDAGVTLIEVVVAMSIMSVMLAMFTGGILQISRSTNKTDSVSAAQSQLNVAFLRLDKEIRYAAGISTPASVGANPYVEFLITNSGTPVCTQLRLNVTSRQLQRRTWTQGTSPLAPTPWMPLASDVSSAQPFTLSSADSTFNFQRLRVQLAASAGAGATATTKRTDITFTAMNTSLTTSSATVCTEGRLVP